MVWALADHQGTVRDLIDDGGNVVNHINYDSFGRLVSESAPTFDFRYGYTGRERDSETGLEYYRARYYDSAVGRFVSEDPIGFAAGDSNLTRYVGNSPTNFVDPSGLEGLIWGESGFNPLAPILPLVEGVGSEIGAAIKGAGAVLDKILVPPVGNGELPRGYQGKQRGNFGEFDPNNYWRKTKPATIPTFTNTGGKTPNFDPTNYLGFPTGPDACSIRGLGGFNTGHGRQDNSWLIPPFLRSEVDPEEAQRDYEQQLDRENSRYKQKDTGRHQREKEQIERVMRDLGIPESEREDFSNLIHRDKKGVGKAGNANFTDAQLRKLGREYLNEDEYLEEN
jgi:RHS repeat-associated protein